MSGTFVKLGDQYAEVIGRQGDAIIFKPMNNIDKRREKIDLEIELEGRVEFYSSEEYRMEEFMEMLNKYQRKGATHIHINTDSYYDSIETVIAPYCHRQETDQEYSERMEKLDWIEKQETEKREEKERAEFERLKNKYA